MNLFSIYAAALGTCIGYVLLDRWKPVRAPAVLRTYYTQARSGSREDV